MYDDKTRMLLRELDLLFETPTRALNTVMPAQRNVVSVLPRITTEVELEWGSDISSPTSSSQTLALDDEEIRRLFESVKNDMANEKPLPTFSFNRALLPNGTRPKLSARSSLNPNAAPFVPILPAQSSPVQTPTLKPDSPPPEPLTWPPQLSNKTSPILALWEKASAVSTHELPRRALVIVSGLSCTDEAMRELALLVCSHSAHNPSLHERRAAATFSKMLYLKFQHIHGETVAQSFLWHLSTHVHNVFLSYWSSMDNVSSVTYQQAASPAYADCAVSFSGFIGDLFKQDLLCALDIATCLDVLLSEFVSFHHLEAIGVMVLHAGPMLWQKTRADQGDLSVDDFTMWLSEAVARCGASNEVEAREQDQDQIQALDELDALAQGILETVQGWDAALKSGLSVPP